MIKLFEQYNEYKQIEEWLVYMDIYNYTINDDLTVDVYDSVNITRNGLTEIPIQFGTVNGFFNCSYNNLTSLNGCPVKVEDTFDCTHNLLTSLEYCPEFIGGHLYIYDNKITTLKYVPETIIGSISLYNNLLPYVLDNFRGNYKFITKHQDDYGIWNTDGSFNNGRWKMLLKDYENKVLE